MNQESSQINGIITQALPNTMFRVDLDDGRKVLATLKGTMRKTYVRIFPGDRVKVEMTPYDEQRGRIIAKL